MDTDLNQQAFRLGDWLVEPAINRLSDGQRSSKLQPQLIRLLSYLASHPGEMLSREQLLAQVWEREFVNDEVLSRCIAQLRQALGDSAKQPVYIETIPRKGYRLLVMPEVADQAAGSSTQRRSLWYGVAAGLFMVLAVVALQAGWLSNKPIPPNTNSSSDISRSAHHFTSQPGIERSASFSMDGSQLLYVKTRPDGSDIYLSDVDGSRQSVLISSPAYLDSPVFSPDQNYIAFIVRTAEGCLVELYEMADQSREPLIACWNGPGSTLDWSHDGRWLAYSYRAAVGGGLAMIDIQTRTTRVLTYPENPQQIDSGPRFSTEDRYLSFSRGNTITRELYRLELQGTHGARRLTFDEQLVTGHDWVDEGRVVYASDKQAVQALWMLNVDSGQISYLGARNARNPAFNAATGQLIYEQWHFQANIWALQPGADDEPQPLIVSNRYDNQPAFSPDSEILAFCSNRSGSDSLWLAQADGSQSRLAYRVDDARVARPAWSPDGQRLIVSVYSEQGSQLHELTKDGQLVRIIEAAGEHASNAVYHPDGQRLLYIKDTPETPELWQVGLGFDSRPAQRVGTILANRVQVSQSGLVLFTRPGEAGIFALNLDGLQERQVINDLPAFAWNDWSVVNNSLIYAAEQAVWKIDLLNGERIRLSDFLPTAIGITLALSPDEQTLLVTRTDEAEIDLVLNVLE